VKVGEDGKGGTLRVETEVERVSMERGFEMEKFEVFRF